MAAATAAGELLDQTAHVSATRSDDPPAGAPAHHMKGGGFDNPWPTWEVRRLRLLHVVCSFMCPHVGVWCKCVGSHCSVVQCAAPRDQDRTACFY